jgi:GxxExxY protein
MAIHDLKYNDITGKIIGIAMNVHRYFGLGFQEVIYHRALIIELRNAGISYSSETERTIMYYDFPVGRRRADLIVEGKVLVELKALSELDNNCLNQALNYLKVFNLEVGLLLNFGASSLGYRRLINEYFVQSQQSNPSKLQTLHNRKR